MKGKAYRRENKVGKPKKVIISAAITGAIHTPGMSPYLPGTPDEIIKQAVDAHRAGAAIIHIHARNEKGEPTSDINVFRYILSGIKSECDAPIGITTGGAAGMTTQERFAIIEEFQPEMASLNAGSMNFCFSRLMPLLEHPEYDWERPFVEKTYDNVFKNTFQDMQYCLETMNRCKTLPEYEVFDYGQLANLAYFKKEGMITQPIYIQFVPGVMGAMPMSGESMLFMIDQAKKLLGNEIQYSTVGGGRRMFRYETMMAINGGNVRVGMEDGLYIRPDGTLAHNNAEQVSKLKGILEALDFEIANSEEAREMLHLKGSAQVRF